MSVSATRGGFVCRVTEAFFFLFLVRFRFFFWPSEVSCVIILIQNELTVRSLTIELQVNSIFAIVVVVAIIILPFEYTSEQSTRHSWLKRVVVSNRSAIR